MPKVIAIENSIRVYADDITIDGYEMRVDHEAVLSPTHIMISSVDSIQARKDIWECIKKAKPLWYIDARMSAEIFQMYLVQMDNPWWYQDTIAGQDDQDIPNDPCTSKATIYTGAMAAGHIGAAVRRIITTKQKPGVMVHNIFTGYIEFLSMFHD
jgi:hypothetical protein